jgi:hypothetical protein
MFPNDVTSQNKEETLRKFWVYLDLKPTLQSLQHQQLAVLTWHGKI